MNTHDLRTLADLICANDSPTVRPGDAAKALNDAADEIDRLHRNFERSLPVSATKDGLPALYFSEYWWVKRSNAKRAYAIPQSPAKDDMRSGVSHTAGGTQVAKLSETQPNSLDRMPTDAQIKAICKWMEWDYGDKAMRAEASELYYAIARAGSVAGAAPSGSDDKNVALADRIARAIDPGMCNYGPSTDGEEQRLLINLPRSEWDQVIRALRSATRPSDEAVKQAKNTLKDAEYQGRSEYNPYRHGPVVLAREILRLAGEATDSRNQATEEK